MSNVLTLRPKPKKSRKTVAYLITMHDEKSPMGLITRKIVDAEAWAYISEGGEVPVKVVADTQADVEADLNQLLDWDESDDEHAERFRGFYIGESSFDGEVSGPGMNEMAEFIIRKNLHIAEEIVFQNYDP